MKKIRTLSDKSLVELQRLRDEVHALKRSVSYERPRARDAASHYIVETPSGGIPAASGTPLEPGEAECLIHKRLGLVKKIEDTSRPQTVYNFSTSAVAGDTLVLAHRDAFGDFWASSEAGCPDGLAPGSYPAVAAVSIAPGAIGPVLVDGVPIDAINQSQCPVAVADRVGLHITPDCRAFFIPCVCCAPSDPVEPDCCDLPLFACVNGRTQAASITNTQFCFCTGSFAYCCAGGFFAFGIPVSSECVETYGNGKFTISVTCDVPDDPVANWVFENGDGVIASGSFTISGMCDTPAPIYRRTVSIGNCVFDIAFAREYSDELCTADTPSDCCDQSLYFCINEVSKLIPLVGGDETFDVSACCNCEGASLELTTSCTGTSPSLNWEYSCGEVTASGSISLADFCTSSSSKILTIDAPCFLQIVASTSETTCAECLFDDTSEPPTTPPPG